MQDAMAGREILDPEAVVGQEVETGGGTSVETTSTQAELEQVRGERDQLLDRLARLQAEFDNARKREAKERADSRDYTVTNTVEPFLSVMDNFQLALKANGTAEQLRSGVELFDGLGGLIGLEIDAGERGAGRYVLGFRFENFAVLLDGSRRVAGVGEQAGEAQARGQDVGIDRKVFSESSDSFRLTAFFSGEQQREIMARGEQRGTLLERVFVELFRFGVFAFGGFQ